jgi:hypothetical protein
MSARTPLFFFIGFSGRAHDEGMSVCRFPCLADVFSQSDPPGTMAGRLRSTVQFPGHNLNVHSACRESVPPCQAHDSLHYLYSGALQ